MIRKKPLFTVAVLACEVRGTHPGGVLRARAVGSVVQPLVDRITHQFDPVVEVEFGESVLHVVLDSAVGDRQPLRDLFVGQPLGDKAQYLGLSGSQLRSAVPLLDRGGPRGVCGQTPIFTQHQPREPGGVDGLPGVDVTNRFEQLLTPCRLDQVARRPRLDRSQDVLPGAAGRQYEYMGRLLECVQSRGEVHARGVRQVQVHHGHGRPGRRGDTQHLGAIARRPDHVHPRFLEITCDRVSPHRVIVHDQDSDLLAVHAEDPRRPSPEMSWPSRGRQSSKSNSSRSSPRGAAINSIVDPSGALPLGDWCTMRLPRRMRSISTSNPASSRVSRASLRRIPTTSGTSTSGGPLDTVRVTVPFMPKLVPVSGSWLITTPSSTSSLSSSTTSTSRSRSSKVERASSSSSPTTAGTGMPRLMVSVMLPSRSAVAPASGLVSITSPGDR